VRPNEDPMLPKPLAHEDIFLSVANAQDPAKAAKINADVPAHLARLSREKGFILFYISTDYVFNGRK
jgi:dTDP-4-dehydrorhamnose reductase